VQAEESNYLGGALCKGPVIYSHLRGQMLITGSVIFRDCQLYRSEKSLQARLSNANYVASSTADCTITGFSSCAGTLQAGSVSNSSTPRNKTRRPAYAYIYAVHALLWIGHGDLHHIVQ
jgi:hypothetical protein